MATKRKAAKAASRSLSVDAVRELALALPETTERPSYGTPGFRVRDKLFARMLDDGMSVVIKMSFEQREAMVASAPHIFSVTPHYESHPMVIVSLATVERAMLEELLTDAWQQMAPARRVASPTPRAAKRAAPRPARLPKSPR